jgi:hypothetical protein
MHIEDTNGGAFPDRGAGRVIQVRLEALNKGRMAWQGTELSRKDLPVEAVANISDGASFPGF